MPTLSLTGQPVASQFCPRTLQGSRTEVSGLPPAPRFTLRCRHRQPAPACPFGARSGRPRLCQTKNNPGSLTLRMLYPGFSHERQEDIGPFGKKPPEIAPSFIRNGIAADKEIVGHMTCFASHAVERHDQRFDAVAVIMQHHRAAAS